MSGATLVYIGDLMKRGTVVCDLCSRDCTSSAEPGGYIFAGKGVCPTCAPAFLEQINKCNEEDHISDRARDGESFADFIRRVR